jgi:hypothetical protein
VVGGVVLAIVIASTVLTRGTPPNGASTLGWLEVAAPTGLRADAGMFEVTLRWIQPSGGPKVSGYDIYRNGAFHVHLDGTPTTFVDEEAFPVQRYEYEIEARSGPLSSDRASIHVWTSRAPLGMARLEGTYEVEAKLTFAYGYDEYPSLLSYTFVFEPMCEAGACSTWLRIPEDTDLKISLSRRGAEYEGTVRGVFVSTCEGKPRISSASFFLKIERADAVDGEWVATELSGGLDHSEAAQRGCPPAFAAEYLQARLVP